jgi:hypothetical protein
MKWVTRERPKTDRIACLWLIARFIDKDPEFLYVPGDVVLKVAAETEHQPIEHAYQMDNGENNVLPYYTQGGRARH